MFSVRRCHGCSISGTNIKLEIVTTCLICVGVAEQFQCRGPWEERNCPDCGHYRISDELILALMDQGQIFDVAKTRSWLDSRRIEMTIPTIKIHEALLVTR